MSDNNEDRSENNYDNTSSDFSNLVSEINVSSDASEMRTVIKQDTRK